MRVVPHGEEEQAFRTVGEEALRDGDLSGGWGLRKSSFPLDEPASLAPLLLPTMNSTETGKVQGQHDGNPCREPRSHAGVGDLGGLRTPARGLTRMGTRTLGGLLVESRGVEHPISVGEASGLQRFPSVRLDPPSFVKMPPFPLPDCGAWKAFDRNRDGE
jgi:hypothetical protein